MHRVKECCLVCRDATWAVVHKLPNHGCVSRQHHGDGLPACPVIRITITVVADRQRACLRKAASDQSHTLRKPHRRCRSHTHVAHTPRHRWPDRTQCCSTHTRVVLYTCGTARTEQTVVEAPGPSHMPAPRLALPAAPTYKCAACRVQGRFPTQTHTHSTCLKPTKAHSLPANMSMTPAAVGAG